MQSSASSLRHGSRNTSTPRPGAKTPKTGLRTATEPCTSNTLNTRDPAAAQHGVLQPPVKTKWLRRTCSKRHLCRKSFEILPPKPVPRPGLAVCETRGLGLSRLVEGSFPFRLFRFSQAFSALLRPIAALRSLRVLSRRGRGGGARGGAVRSPRHGPHGFDWGVEGS